MRPGVYIEETLRFGLVQIKVSTFLVKVEAAPREDKRLGVILCSAVQARMPCVDQFPIYFMEAATLTFCAQVPRHGVLVFVDLGVWEGGRGP